MGLTPDTIYESLHPSYNQDMVFRAGEGAGRSGSFFFFSHDKRFIIKTMSVAEHTLFLSRMLSGYENHVSEKSLIAKILGVFTVRSTQLNDIHLMLMANTMRTAHNFKKFYVFDLKGSTVDRISSSEGGVKKDLNYK